MQFKKGDILCGVGIPAFEYDPDLQRGVEVISNLRLANEDEEDAFWAGIVEGFMVLISKGVDIERKDNHVYISPIKWQYLSGIVHEKYEAAGDEIKYFSLGTPGIFKIDKIFITRKCLK